MLQNLKSKKEEGFTIIEVLIVLAIAGLILLIVLIAVPQLQRNQRNEARRNVLSRIATEINNFSGNNRGEVPTPNSNINTGFDGGFADRYLKDGTDFRDTFKLNGQDPNLIPSGAIGGNTDDITYRRGVNCNGEGFSPSTGNDRDFALVVTLEGGARFCLDNRN